MNSKTISADFPFASHFVDVYGSRMHYIDEGEGEGDPILFLHGNPTSSYLWRNIIPYLVPHGRCIAPDLIGMGKSDKPALKYDFFDHAKYLDGFIEALGLENVTLVIHDWGSGLGFYYAHRHQSNIKAIAFMEAMIRPLKWTDLPKDFRLAFRFLRAPFIGWLMISVMNIFIKQMLPQAVVRPLVEEEKRFYAGPYPDIASRLPLRQWPLQIPIEGKPAGVHDAISAYAEWLQKTELPKILFYAKPGGLIPAELVKWCKDHYKNLETVDIGAGLHFIQEDNPQGIGEALAKWYTSLGR